MCRMGECLPPFRAPPEWVWVHIFFLLSFFAFSMKSVSLHILFSAPLARSPFSPSLFHGDQTTSCPFLLTPTCNGISAGECLWCSFFSSLSLRSAHQDEEVPPFFLQKPYPPPHFLERGIRTAFSSFPQAPPPPPPPPNFSSSLCMNERNRPPPPDAPSFHHGRPRFFIYRKLNCPSLLLLYLILRIACRPSLVRSPQDMARTCPP